MKKFYVYERKGALNPELRYSFVRSAVNIWAFLFHVFWLLFSRLWSYAILFSLLLALAYFAVGNSILHEVQVSIVMLVAKLFLAFEANHIFAQKLEREGYELQSVVFARNLADARVKFFEYGGYERE